MNDSFPQLQLLRRFAPQLLLITMLYVILMSVTPQPSALKLEEVARVPSGQILSASPIYSSKLTNFPILILLLLHLYPSSIY